MAVSFDWAGTAPLQDFLLLVRKDGAVVERLSLPPKPVVVLGRNGTLSDLVFDHPSLSRQHAALVAGANGGVYLADLKSTHGTLHEGVKLASQGRVALRIGADEADGRASTFSLGASSRQLSLVHTGRSTGSGEAVHGVASAADSSHDEPSFPPPPRRLAEEEEDGGFGTARRAFPPPPPRRPAPAAAPQLSEPLPQTAKPNTAVAPAEDEAQRRAQERQQRADEIAAAIASMQGPLPLPVAAPVQDEGAEDAGPGQNEDNEDEEAALAAAMGLPLAFGASSSSGGGGDGAPSGSAGSKRAPEQALQAYAAKRRKLEDGTAALFADDSAHAASPEAAAAALGLPVSHEAALASHSKAVGALAFDAPGARLLSGGADYMLKFFDFAGMDAALQPFREVLPTEGQPVLGLALSPSGDRVLVGTGGVKPRVFSRDGQPQLTFIRGDQYIVDIANTKGHVAAVTAVAWHPTNSNLVLTAALDSSVRLWDLTGKTIFNELVCREVVKLKTAGGQRAGVTAAAFAPDGASFAAATDDGGLAVFALRPAGHKYLRPDASKPGAHAAGGETTCLVYSPDGARFATRNTADNCVKVWDAKALGRGASGGCLAVIKAVETLHPSTNVAWSPDGRLLLAGTAVRKGGAEPGALLAFDLSPASGGSGAASSSATLALSPADAVYTLTLDPGVSAVSVAWHAGLNQLAVGCSDGTVRVMFSPSSSKRGVLQCVAKEAAKRRDASDAIPLPQGAIVAVNALPMYRDDVPAGAFIPGRPKPRWQELVKAKEEAAKARHVPSSLPEGVQPEYVYKGVKPVVKAYAEEAGGPNLRTQDPAEVLRAYASSERFQSQSERLRAALNPGAAHTVLASRTLEDEMEKQGEELRAALKDNIAGRS